MRPAQWPLTWSPPGPASWASAGGSAGSDAVLALAHLFLQLGAELTLNYASPHQDACNRKPSACQKSGPQS